MANPVWVLSVDLQTKTATFQSGMAEAARSARTAFNDIKSGASGMAEGVSEGSIDIRHSLGLVDNVIRGAHAQAMADLIRMYAQSAIVMTALPIAATVAGFALLGGIVYEAYEHVAQLRAEQEKLNNSMTSLGTAGQNALNSIADKLLEAQKRADELRNDHLGALQKELELIDHASLTQLVQTFGILDKAAVAAFDDLKNKWYEFGIGAEGAKHALTEFQVQYESLLAKGDSKGANDLLAGTRDSAARILQSMKATAGDWSGSSDKEITAQQVILAALNGQVAAQQQIEALKKADQGNATTAAGNEASARNSEAARQAADAQVRMGSMAIAADRATADAQLQIKRASIEARLQSDLDFAARERDLALAGNAADIAALDKAGKDYANQLKELKEKQLEIQQQYATATATATAKATVEEYERDLAATEQGIRDTIEATRQGTAARLAAIQEGMRQEIALGLQDTQNFRELQTQKTEVIRLMSEEQAKLTAEGAKLDAENTEKMGMLSLAAEREAASLRDSARRVSMAQRIAEDINFANQEFAIKMTAASQELAALDKNGKEYETKLKAIQDQQKQLIQQHENEVTAIKTKAEIERNQTILGAERRFTDSIAQGLTQTLMGQKSFASTMLSLGDQVVSGLIQNTIKMALTRKMDQQSAAAKAASDTYANVSGWPVVGPFLAPEMAAAAWAGVMAFEGGGIVPGVGRGDIVPARLEPGEGVVPKGVMAGLSEMARSGRMAGGNQTHMVYNPTIHVHTIDSTGVRKMLREHNQDFADHWHREMRKANR